MLLPLGGPLVSGSNDYACLGLAVQPPEQRLVTPRCGSTGCHVHSLVKVPRLFTPLW